MNWFSHRLLHVSLGVGGLVLGLYVLGAAAAVRGQDVKLDAKLGSLGHAWAQPMHRLTLEEYEATLQYWQEQHSDRLIRERVGNSREGLGIYLLQITDPAVPKDDKQVALITALHGGPERSGSTTALTVAEYLLGDSPDAAEIRRRQIVLIMPIPNPYAFFTTDRFGNSSKVDPYNTSAHWDLSTMTLKNPEAAPEVVAVLEVMDRFQPEVHLDLHGTGLQEYPDSRLAGRTGYQGQTMIEITGSAYSNYSLRPWDWRVTEAMVAAGEAAGYPSDRFEADAQRCFAGPGLEGVAPRFWSGRPLFYTAHYGYAKYHTMIGAHEIGWEESGRLRTLGLLRIGNGPWRNDPVPGYPVNRIKSFVGHFLVAEGDTAAARRVSRVAWWQAQSRLGQAILYPQTDGRESYIVSLNAAGAALLDADLDQFVANLRSQPDFDADAIATFIRHGPEVKLAIDGARPPAAEPLPAPAHGLGLLFRLPYDAPEIADLRLNGHELQPARYRRWTADGWTHVQIPVSADQAARANLLVVTCAYRPNRARSTGWVPPAAVLQRLKRN